jgi:hypothetical protein
MSRQGQNVGRKRYDVYIARVTEGVSCHQQRSARKVQM